MTGSGFDRCDTEKKGVDSMNSKRISSTVISVLMLSQAAVFPPVSAEGSSLSVTLSAFASDVRQIAAQSEGKEYFNELTFDRKSGILYRDGAETGGDAEDLSVRGGRLVLKTGKSSKKSGNSVQSVGDYTAFEDAAEEYGYHYNEADGVVTITNDFQSARLIVKAKGNIDRYGAKSAAEGYRDLHILQYSDASEAYAAYQLYQSDPQVQYVQPSRRVQLDPVPDDVSADSILPAGAGRYLTWGADMLGTEQFISTYLQKELLPEVIVAVIDTGLNPEPAVFDGRILDSGLNFSNSGDDTVSDDLGHGTHCTGTICELTPANVKILPVKVFDRKGHADDEQIYLGLMYAIEQGAGILNMSFGGLGVSPLEVEALAEAERAGVICCAAAGNNGDDAMYYYPGGIDTAITVGAVNSNLELAGFSNRGSLVDVVAPGVGIVSYTIGGADKTEKMNGTSMATPHVTACCALLRSHDPDMSPRRAEALLRLNAVDLGPEGFDKTFAWGLVCMKGFRWDDGICCAPEFSAKAGNYSSAQTVEIDTETPDACIFYTTDGSVPSSENGTLYTEPLTVSVTTWLRAITVKHGFIDSTVSDTVYSINGMDVPVPFAVREGVLTKYNGIRKQVTVPDAIDGQKITTIGADAFRGCGFIEEVRLPDGVASIGNGAFADCSNLQKITAAGVSVLEDDAFSGSSTLENVILSGNIVSVGKGAFQNCSKLREIRLKGLTAVPDDCFSGCSLLMTAEIPDATSFGHRCFADCGKLRTVASPFHRVTSVGERAFSGCVNWGAALYLPALKTIGAGAFNNDNALKAVCLPETVSELPAELFSGCSGLRLLSLPGVKAVGEAALALKKTSSDLTAEIPYEQITEAGTNAFVGFPFGNALDTVRFSSLKSAEPRAFSGAIAGVLDFPQLTAVPEEMFADAKIKAVRLEQAATIGSSSLGSCQSVVLSDKCHEIVPDAWKDRSQNPICICAAEPISALDSLNDYVICDEPLILRTSADTVTVSSGGYAPMQVCAAAPGIIYQWILVSGEQETVISDASGELYEADTSETGVYSYICRMTAKNGKQDSVTFQVTVTESADTMLSLSDGGMTEPLTDTQLLKIICGTDQAVIRSEGTAAVKGRMTDGAGKTLAVLTHSADGSAFLSAACTELECRLETVPLWDGVYVVSASKKPMLSLNDCRIEAFAEIGSDSPKVTVLGSDGSVLAQDKDYVLHISSRNHICTVSVFGAGKYCGNSELTVPVYPVIPLDRPMPVSLRGADDHAVYCFVPNTSGKYYIYSTRTAGYAEEAAAFNRTGVYAGGSRYVTIRTSCYVSETPDDTGKKLRYTDYSVPNSNYFSDEIELRAGHPYYLQCSAESSAEYAIVVSQEPAEVLRGAIVLGNFYCIYNGEPFKPDIKVTLNDTPLTEGVDYLRIDSHNDLPGEAMMTIIGMGRYTGKIEKTYDIIRRGSVDSDELTPLDETVNVVCANSGAEEIWFRADTGVTDKEKVRYRILNQKISGGALRYTLFRADARTGLFSRIKQDMSNDFELVNGTYCLMLYPQYTEKGGQTAVTVLIPHDLDTAELTISDMPYTGGPVVPDITMTEPDGTVLQKDVDFRLTFPVENGNVMFGESRYIIEPTERSYGSKDGVFQIYVDLPEDPPEISVGDHSVLLTLDDRLAVYRLTAEEETKYTLTSADAADIVFRVFSTDAEMLEQTYGAGTKSLSFTVPKDETRLLMIKFNGTIREGTINYKLATDLRLLSDCEALTEPVPWTGSRVLPDLTFLDGDYVLQEHKDYELRYTCDDVNIGTATANYTGIGDYFGLCDVNYHIIVPELFDKEEFSAMPIQIDTEYDIKKNQLEDRDCLIYSYSSGVDTEMRFDIYNCMCRMTVQLYDGEGHFRDSIFMKSLGSMEFDIKAGESCYLLFSATDISGSNQETNFKLSDKQAADYKTFEDQENGVVYRINSAKKYAEVYSMDYEQERIVLLPKVSGIPVKFVPEGLFTTVPDSCTVIGYAGCAAARFADRYHFAYYEPRDSAVDGDLNNDGTFSVADAVMLARIVNESETAADLRIRFEQADVNGDGCIDLLDLRKMIVLLDA